MEPDTDTTDGYQALFLEIVQKRADDLRAFFLDAFVALGVNGISGDYVEFGSEGAVSATAAHRLVSRVPVDRHIWAFDTFAGLPATDEPLDHHPAFTPGFQQGGLDAFHARCAEAGMLRSAYTAIPGLFEDTLAADATELPHDIALAYVDCNLYSSTVTVLDFLAPRLKHGMIVAFDDYFCYTADRISGEQMALQEFLARDQRWHFERFKDSAWGGASFVVQHRDQVQRT